MNVFGDRYAVFEKGINKQGLYILKRRPSIKVLLTQHSKILLRMDVFQALNGYRWSVRKFSY
jgi:hypothetical protein